MLIIPAIDIMDGCVVRLAQGRRDKKIYSRDPVKTAKHWVKSGAKFLHIVDLDGAFSGAPKNINIAKTIVAEVAVPVEFGGGIREIETIRGILKAGISRVVLGTRAIESKPFLREAFDDFGDKVIISIDAQSGKIMVEGWQEEHKKASVKSFAATLKAIGFKEIIYTDTLKDGMLKGPNILAIKQLLRESGLKIIASGGISKLDDLHRLKAIEKHGVSGVIVGKALYEGRFTLKEALRCA